MAHGHTKRSQDRRRDREEGPPGRAREGQCSGLMTVAWRNHCALIGPENRHLDSQWPWSHDLVTVASLLSCVCAYMTSVDDGWYGTDDVRHVRRCHPSTSWYRRRPILYSMSYFIIFLEFLGLYYRVKRSPKHYCRGLYQFVRFRLIWFVVVSLQRRPRILIVMHVPACVVAHSLSWCLDVPAIHVWRLSWQFPCTYTIRYDTIEEINVDSKAEYSA